MVKSVFLGHTPCENRKNLLNTNFFNFCLNQFKDYSDQLVLTHYTYLAILKSYNTPSQVWRALGPAFFLFTSPIHQNIIINLYLVDWPEWLVLPTVSLMIF